MNPDKMPIRLMMTCSVVNAEIDIPKIMAPSRRRLVARRLPLSLSMGKSQ